MSARYFSYLFRTAAYMGEVNNYSRGIVADRNRLYWDEFKQIPTAFPPTKEQRAIADFVELLADHSCSGSSATTRRSSGGWRTRSSRRPA
jgi:hypothetical protein